MMLTRSQYTLLNAQARKISGCISQLVSLRKKPLQTESLRRLCEKIYLFTDGFVETLDEYEKSQANKKFEAETL